MHNFKKAAALKLFKPFLEQDLSPQELYDEIMGHEKDYSDEEAREIMVELKVGPPAKVEVTPEPAPTPAKPQATGFNLRYEEWTCSPNPNTGEMEKQKHIKDVSIPEDMAARLNKAGMVENVPTVLRYFLKEGGQ